MSPSRGEAPVVLLLGPTASGKSAAAMALAERFPVEIVSVDSAQVYRSMDIGTAKPTLAERAAVPHHLIDVVDPAQAYSAARFAEDARRLVGEIRARGRLPLLAGGTMLYAKALAEGLHDLPQADPALRARLEAEAAELGWPSLHVRLASVDPATAARLEPADAQRIQRALEVFELTGRPLSAWLAGQRDDRASRGDGLRFVRIALEPSDRSVLHARIATRFAAMIEAGLVDEVRALRARGDLHLGLPSMRCVGYRQTWEYLDAAQGLPAGEAPDTRARTRVELIERGVAATRQLAKRQLTWLRAMHDRVTIDCAADGAVVAARIIEAFERAIG